MQPASREKHPYVLSEADHPRTFRDNLYVYAVWSRRSDGVSVGINLNPDKACNFDCIYCEVDRTKRPQDVFVGLGALLDELRAMLTSLQPGGAMWSEPEFRTLPPEKRVVRDIAFSGDGEPTTFKNFSQIVDACVKVKEQLGFSEAKVVLITNATGLERPDVQKGLELFDAHNGEIWAKLDAGTAAYFALIDNTAFPYERILANLTHCAQRRPTVIQSCFMKVRGVPPDDAEIAAYVERLKAIRAAGGTIKFVQVYTVARPPAYSIVSSLSDAELDRIAATVQSGTGLPTRTFYGSVAEGLGLMGEAPEHPASS